MENIGKYQQFIEGLEALSRFCGCHFVIKTGERAWLAPLPRELRYHCCPFCRAVKGRSGRMNLLCNRHHAETALREAVHRREPFETTCHAGVTELVIPILAGGCRGAVFAGPFISTGPADMPENLRRIYEELPKLPRLQMAPLRALVCALLTACEPETWTKSPLALLPTADYARIDERMQKTLQYLHRNFRKPLSVNEVSRAVGLSRSRFIHCFTRAFGISFCEYLQRLRLSEALPWVELTDLPFSAVAEECGFADQSRFSALFKRYCHVSPGSFRKRRSVFL